MTRTLRRALFASMLFISLAAIASGCYYDRDRGDYYSRRYDDRYNTRLGTIVAMTTVVAAVTMITAVMIGTVGARAPIGITTTISNMGNWPAQQSAPADYPGLRLCCEKLLGTAELARFGVDAGGVNQRLNVFFSDHDRIVISSDAFHLATNPG